MENLYNNLVEVINKEIEKQINEEYTQYKTKCLKDLEFEMEKRRNNIVSSVLNGVSIELSNNDMYRNEPIINIRIKKDVYLKDIKEEDK